MTIDEAINHCYEVARSNQKLPCDDCKNEHLQLAKWLEELRDFKNKSNYAEDKYGTWEFRYEGTYRRCRCYCSVCGKHSGIGGIKENQLKPYCPNCGAKMNTQ